MRWSQADLGSLLLASAFASQAFATVTCEVENTVGTFRNPSFETGDLTDWTALQATGATSAGAVVSGDDAAEGEYY